MSNGNNTAAKGRRNQGERKAKAPKTKSDRSDGRSKKGATSISNIARAAKVTGKASGKSLSKPLSQKKVLKMLRAAGQTYGLQSVDFMAWVEQLSRPFSTTLVKCPVNFNPVPTLLTLPAVTVATGRFAVSSGRCREFVVFPGHIEEAQNDPMDGEAYHSYLATIGGVDYNPGPCRSQGHPGACIAISPDELITNLPQGNLAAYTGIGWDNDLPFTGDGGAGHLRWKLTACGVRWKNTNTNLNKGGDVKSVQPPIAFLPAVPAPGWVGYDRFPSYKLYDDIDGEISWIPRIEDLSMWHSNGVGQSNSSNGGIRILFSAPDVDQTIEFEAVFKWEIGGSSVASLSTAAQLLSGQRSTAEDMVNHLSNTSHTAAGAIAAVKDVASTALHAGVTIAKGLKAGAELYSDLKH